MNIHDHSNATQKVHWSLLAVLLVCVFLIGFPMTREVSAALPPSLRSVRVDLSAIEPPSDATQLIRQILERVDDAGGNTVFLSPWSDGRANYRSRIARQNDYGRQRFVEQFLTLAHAQGIRVYAWFVTGKDNFLPQQHPEWYAKTIRGRPYRHEDEPGLFLPVASLSNDAYRQYHRSLLREAGRLPFDGWVISEPLVGWGDRFDDTYADFSASAVRKFRQRYGVDPRLLFTSSSLYYYEHNPILYQRWVEFRAATVTTYVQETMRTIRERSKKPILITVFTEPNRRGRLASFDDLKEWLGTDITALAKLKPNGFEIQDLFLHFEHRQSPTWTTSFIRQFRAQLKASIPVYVSVQGFDSPPRKLTAKDFSTAITRAQNEGVNGVSFYAYHALREEHWAALKKLWR